MVASTETYTDRLKASKDLADDNAQQIQYKEMLKLDIDTLILQKAELIQTIGVTPEHYKTLEDEHAKRMEEIDNQTVKAIQKRQTAEDGLAEAEKTLKAIIERTEKQETREKELNGSVASLEGIEKSLIASNDEKADKFATEKKQAEKELGDMRIEFERIKSASAKLDKNSKARHEKVVEEEALLGIRRSDLEIYETRLRAKYPNDSIILS